MKSLNQIFKISNHLSIIVYQISIVSYFEKNWPYFSVNAYKNSADAPD